ncbi:MAG: glycosyltransferase family 4 protein [Planctomycetales bacterium]|nr:glycosyltransferase family 4 protein [Planctomycetales bacterium]
MRITIFSHYFPPEGNAPASRTFEHARQWVEAGHEVTVVTCVPNVPTGIAYAGYRNHLWPQRESRHGIEVVRVWTYLSPNSGTLPRIGNYVSYMLSAVLAFMFFVRRPNVIVATSPQFFCGWAGILAGWLKWTPTVLEIRDIWPESIMAVGAMHRGWTIRFVEWLERWMYRAASHIVTVGKGYRDNIQTKVPAATRISVITNGVDGRLFAPAPVSECFRRRFGLGDRFVCAYVGTLGMAHGLDVVIRAAELLRQRRRDDIVFLLVGDGAHRARLERQVEQAELGSYVRFAGLLPKADMPMALTSSDALLIHLRKCELFTTVIPSKLFESMAVQRPIILGVRGEAAEILHDFNAGLQMEPENEHDLASAVVRLAEDPEYAAQLGINGRVAVMEKYRRDVLAAEYLSLLCEVALRSACEDSVATSPSRLVAEKTAERTLAKQK